MSSNDGSGSIMQANSESIFSNVFVTIDYNNLGLVEYVISLPILRVKAYDWELLMYTFYTLSNE